MREFSLIFFLLFTIGCARDEKPIPINEVKSTRNVVVIFKNKPVSNQVEKLNFISQNPDIYIEKTELSTLTTKQKDFEKSYFKPWNMKNAGPLENKVAWAFKTYTSKNSYGEDLKPRDSAFFKKMKDDANFKNYSSINKKAITLHKVNLRAFPTNKPILMNPTKAGEGFPFDYLQNTTIAANKPIFATHYSKNKEWIHIVSSFAFGWVKTNEIVFLKKFQTDIWQKAEQIFLSEDAIPIYSMQGKFLFKSQLGMILALIDETQKDYIVLAVSNYKNSKPLFIKAKISKAYAHKGKLLFNKQNIESSLKQLLTSKYGWGGIYGQRDCSSTMRDFFAPFGLWLPRNSFLQAKVGTVISLKNLNNNEKLKIISEKAIPFRTLLYKKGHIALYVGTNQGEIIIFQNVWGVKTKEDGKEGRYLVGKALFSTLELGKNLKNYDKSASFLEKIVSINILN